MKRACLVVLSMLLAGCTTTPQQFYKNPAEQDTTSLCRAVAQATTQSFKDDVAIELERRGLIPEDCRSRVATQDAVITGVLVAGAAVAVGVAAHNGVFDGMGSYETYAWDRFGYQWRCRSTATGRFVDSYLCSGKPRIDNWP